MIIADTKIFKYSLPVVKPLKLKGEDVHSRDGIILEFQSKQGDSGFGEAAPLAGFSKESLDDVIQQMKRAKSFFINQPLPNNLYKLSGHFHQWLSGLQFHPSLQFGIESAILNLLANSQKKPFYKLITHNYRERIHINGLLNGTQQEVVAQAKDMRRSGFKSIKLKVGQNEKEDVAKIRSVYDIVKNDALLHLDANQSWDMNTATRICDEIGLAAVEYIEEPFKDKSYIPEFIMKTTIPVALDETLIELPFEDIKHIEGVDILVLKPTLIGGIEKTWALKTEGRRLGFRTVISSCFESELGLLTLAHLAGCTSRDVPAGLDTAKWFGKNLLKTPLKFSHGTIDISNQMINKNDLNFDLLEEIRS